VWNILVFHLENYSVVTVTPSGNNNEITPKKEVIGDARFPGGQPENVLTNLYFGRLRLFLLI
jgi:hypothetical protein